MLFDKDELARAERFAYEKDRCTYIHTRGTLRKLLGQYLQMKPESFSFEYSAYGKPFLPSNGKPDMVSFNVSHSGGYALLAFTHQAAIGVDLEAKDHYADTEVLAQHYFSPSERDQLLNLLIDEQVSAFYRTWTRKEAFLKAHGEGLGLPLDGFSVTVAPDEPTKLERIDWAPGTEEDWSLISFTVARDLPGAVVVEGKVRLIRYVDLKV